MEESNLTVAQQLAQAASEFQRERTGHTPGSVTVVLSEDTLVITLHEALSAAEKLLARSAAGAVQVQEFHRQLFSSSSDSLRQAIKRITGRDVREATAEVETASGAVIHAFTTGAMVQVFLLSDGARLEAEVDASNVERAEDDGLRVPVAMRPPGEKPTQQLTKGG